MGLVPVYGYHDQAGHLAEQRKSRLETLRDIEREAPAEKKFAIRRLIQMVEEVVK